MDSEVKEQKSKLRLPEILRCLFFVGVVVFLLFCMVFLFLDRLEMKQRLTAIDEKLNTFELTLKMSLPKSPAFGSRDIRFGAEDLHVRLRRAVTVSLQSLEKRLKVLEIR